MTPTSTDSSSPAGPSAAGLMTPVLNLVTANRPFKNQRYSAPKKYKNMKQILALEKAMDMPLDVPTCRLARVFFFFLRGEGKRGGEGREDGGMEQFICEESVLIKY